MYYEKKANTILGKNSTNISNTKNHLSPQLTDAKMGITTYDVGNQCSGLVPLQKGDGIKL
jgi:hypothetical protein